EDGSEDNEERLGRADEDAVRESHEEDVRLAAQVARDEADHEADADGQEGDRETHNERDPRAPDELAEDVPALQVRAPQVLVAGRIRSGRQRCEVFARRGDRVHPTFPRSEPDIGNCELATDLLW